MMYEFSKKQIRQEFKKTEYGKKVNSWLYISLTITAILLVVEFVLGFLDGADIYKASEVMLDILNLIVFISLIVTCYFDGKRDGAIEQFKKSKK